MTGKRILIIEDEVRLGMDMQYHLKEAGAAEIEHAATEKEALSLMEQGGWDAVVADANLHGRSIAAVAPCCGSVTFPFWSSRVMGGNACRRSWPPPRFWPSRSVPCSWSSPCRGYSRAAPC